MAFISAISHILFIFQFIPQNNQRKNQRKTISNVNGDVTAKDAIQKPKQRAKHKQRIHVKRNAGRIFCLYSFNCLRQKRYRRTKRGT